MTSEEARAELLTELQILETSSTPRHWYWLSFVDDSRFLGGCLVKASFFEGNERLSFFAAIRRSHELKINPGGECQMSMLDQSVVKEFPVEYREKLIDQATIDLIDHSKGY